MRVIGPFGYRCTITLRLSRTSGVSFSSANRDSMASASPCDARSTTHIANPSSSFECSMPHALMKSTRTPSGGGGPVRASRDLLRRRPRTTTAGAQALRTSASSGPSLLPGRPTCSLTAVDASPCSLPRDRAGDSARLRQSRRPRRSCLRGPVTLAWGCTGSTEMGIRGPARWLSLLIAVGWLVGCASAVGVDRGEGSRETTRAVARQILADRDLDDVLQRARALIASGFDAGSGYPELWIRDFATFMELSCRVHDRAVIRNHLRCSRGSSAMTEIFQTASLLAINPRPRTRAPTGRPDSRLS